LELRTKTAKRIMMLDLFFSSRRRHTRWPRDWRSDVCSSDLARLAVPERWAGWVKDGVTIDLHVEAFPRETFQGKISRINPAVARSEERRVGKECRCRWL